MGGEVTLENFALIHVESFPNKNAYFTSQQN